MCGGGEVIGFKLVQTTKAKGFHIVENDGGKLTIEIEASVTTKCTLLMHCCFESIGGNLELWSVV